MAITGVMRPGYIQIRVLNMEDALRHYCDYMGLEKVGQESDGRVYLHAFDEFDRHSVILRETDQAGLDMVGFKVDEDATLDKLQKKMQASGYVVEQIAAGEQPGIGRKIWIEAPTGHTLEFYADMERSENGPMTDNPDIWRREPRGMRIIRFDHCLLYGPDIEGVHNLFTKILDFKLTEQVVAGDGETQIAAFYSCSNKAHDIAFVRHPEPGKFHHASFLLDSWADVGNAADIMARYNVKIDIGPTRHGITRGQTIYFWDPSGNRNEVFCGGYQFYPDAPVRQWDEEQVGKAIFYYERALNETFLPVVT